MIKSDFHTHTTYCDGKNSASQMAETAYKNGFSAIGFSSHSHTSFDESYCMSIENTEKYINEITALKEEYKGRLGVYLGIEFDRYSDEYRLDRFDYVIGSVHYVLKDGKYLPVDESEEIFLNNIKEYYGGNIFAYCQDYFDALDDLADNDEVDIIGHIDLVTKFNENGRLFDTDNKRYVTALNEALYKLAAKEKILEINTGAISRGYRTTPYPEENILVKWRMLGGRIIFSGDAHSIDGLAFNFDDSVKLAKKCGFKSAVVFENGEFTDVCF